jgi:hypothetical protein
LLESIFLVYTPAIEFSNGGLVLHSQNGYTSNIVPFNSTQTLKFAHLRSILTLCAPNTLTQQGVIFFSSFFFLSKVIFSPLKMNYKTLEPLFFTSPAPAPPRTVPMSQSYLKAMPNVAN